MTVEVEKTVEWLRLLDLALDHGPKSIDGLAMWRLVYSAHVNLLWLLYMHYMSTFYLMS